MSFFTETRPVANKDYYCDSCYFLGDFPSDLTEFEQQAVGVAKNNSFKIKKGERYIKQQGVRDGEWYTYRAIVSIHDIYIKYVYDE